MQSADFPLLRATARRLERLAQIGWGLVPEKAHPQIHADSDCRGTSGIRRSLSDNQNRCKVSLFLSQGTAYKTFQRRALGFFQHDAQGVECAFRPSDTKEALEDAALETTFSTRYSGVTLRLAASN